MSKRNSIVMFIITVLVSMEATSYAGNANVSSDEILQIIKDRSDSISSYRLKGEHYSVVVGTDKLNYIRSTINEACQSRTDNQYGLLIEKLVKIEDDKTPWCVKMSHVNKGGRFRSQQVEADSTTHQITCYDGESFAVYMPSSMQKQVDVYHENEGQFIFSFEQLDIDLIDFFDFDYEYSSTAKKLVFMPKKGLLTEIELDENLATKHILLKNTSEDVDLLEAWHLGTRIIDGFPVPQIIIKISRNDEGIKIHTYKLEEIEINCDIAEKELELGPLPLWATTVDHRTNPVTGHN